MDTETLSSRSGETVELDLLRNFKRKGAVI